MEKHQFKDVNGNVWSINITVKEFMAIKSECGIDLGAIFEDNSDWIQEIISQDNLVKFMSILGICTDVQRDKLDMSMEDFYQGFDGATIESATEALIEGVVNFTPAHKREPLRKLVEVSNRALEKMTSSVMEHLDDEKIDQEMDEAIQKHLNS